MEKKNNSGRLATLNISQVDRFLGQPRKYFDPKKIDGLGKSIQRIGQKNPIQVLDTQNGRFELIDGERRLRACIQSGVQKIRAIVYDDIDQSQQHLDSLTLNFHKEPHTHYEIFVALAKEVSEGRTVQELMDILGKSDAWIYSYLSFRKLSPEILTLLEQDSVNFGEAVLLARVDSHIEQQQIFDAVKDLSPKRRKRAIEKLLHTLNPTQKRRKKPRDLTDYKRMLLSFLDRMSAGSEEIMSMPNSILKKIVADLSEDEKTLWLEDITNSLNNLEMLQSSLSPVASDISSTIHKQMPAEQHSAGVCV